MEKQQKQHLAIFNPPFLELILERRKTIEGRFSKVRCAPFGAVQEGDVVLMKESGGLVRVHSLSRKWRVLRTSQRKDSKNLKLTTVTLSVPTPIQSTGRGDVYLNTRP